MFYLDIRYTLFYQAKVKERFLFSKDVNEAFILKPFRIYVHTGWMNHVKQNVHNPGGKEGQPSSEGNHSDLKLCHLMRIPIYINQLHVISQRHLCGHCQTKMCINEKLQPETMISFIILMLLPDVKRCKNEEVKQLFEKGRFMQEFSFVRFSFFMNKHCLEIKAII